MSQAHKKSHEVWFKDNFFFALADSFYCVFFFFFILMSVSMVYSLLAFFSSCESQKALIKKPKSFPPLAWIQELERFKMTENMLRFSQSANPVLHMWN